MRVVSSCPEASILVVDDVAEWRAIVRQILDKQPNLQIVAEACDGFQAIQRAGELHPDLILLDIGMPVLDGLKTAAHIRQSSPQSKIVFITQESDHDIRSAAREIGALGYVLKSEAMRELLPTIRTALRDGHRNNHAGAPVPGQSRN